MSCFKWNTKDGGPESPVSFYGIEIKCLFSIGVLKFSEGCRESYHTHAFEALTWFLSGSLQEQRLWSVSLYGNNVEYTSYTKSLLPKYTSKENMHRVFSKKDSLCFTLRGPWATQWKEYEPYKQELTTFSKGREIVSKITVK
jgi:hypothetical protein